MVHEIVDGKIFLERIIDAVKAALLQAGKIKRGFAQRLAGNGAGINAAPARMLGTLDHRNAFAKVRRLRTGLFAGWAAADHDQVEVVAQNHIASKYQPRSPA